MNTALGASILARLLALAKQRGDDYSLLLNRFGLERLLYRLSVSPYAERFLLKGALLFAYWYDDPHRPTRDVDLLGFGQDDAGYLVAIFSEIADMELGDGIAFDLASIHAEQIREDNTYGGTRISVVGKINNARCTLQIDIGFGDAVTPEAQTVTFPALLSDFSPPVLKVYPVYTVIAEKYQAMVALGLANSRMKDFYDLAVIARRTDLEGQTLAQALSATFARRNTPLPNTRPLALTPAFSQDDGKKRQWQAFLKKNRIDAEPLEHTVALLARLLWPPTEAAFANTPLTVWMASATGWAPPRL